MLLHQALAAMITMIVCSAVQAVPPNVIFIMVDDVGAADVGFSFQFYHPNATVANHPIRTPRIDNLAATATKLTHYYLHPVCTPTRAALLTGRYAHSASLNGVIFGPSPFGLQSQHTTLAESFRASSYATHMVGKWHLGFSAPQHTPLGKGFDTFFGAYNGAMGYYSKLAGPFVDLTNMTEPYFSPTHTTELFTSEAVRLIQSHAADGQPYFLYLAYNAAHTPLQPEPRHQKPCAHHPYHIRREYCGLVVGLDEAVGNLTDTLTRLGQLDNTIIVFSTDNGGMPNDGGHNYPLRGTKNSLFDGGMRGIGFVRYPPSLSHEYYDGLMHVSDWYPTLLSMAGLPLKNLTFEGFDMSQALAKRVPSPRHEIVLHLDDTHVHTNKTAYRDDQYKIILGDIGDDAVYLEPVEDALNGYCSFMDWLASLVVRWLDLVLRQDDLIVYEIIVNHQRIVLNQMTGHGYPSGSILLFDMVNDPYETQNLAPSRPDLVEKYRKILDQKRKERPSQPDWMQMIKNPPSTTSGMYPGMNFWSSFLKDENEWKQWPIQNAIVHYFIPRLLFYVFGPVIVAAVAGLIGICYLR